MKTKKEIRCIYQNKRDRLTFDKIQSRSILITNKCLEMPIWHLENYHIFLTSLNNNEIDTSSLLSILMGKDKQPIISKILINKNLENYLLNDQTTLKNNHIGIPEPQNGIYIDPKIIDVVFIPLYIFDLNGHRVGYGGGYYDRFLKTCRKDAIKIGLSKFKPINKIKDISKFDIKLDYAVTPDSVFSF